MVCDRATCRAEGVWDSVLSALRLGLLCAVNGCGRTGWGATGGASVTSANMPKVISEMPKVICRGQGAH